MKKKQLKKIISLSYVNHNLDKTRVNKIAVKLTRKDLKEYIKALKIIEKKKHLIVFLPVFEKDKLLEEDIRNKFPGKKIIFKKDKSLIAGIKILDFDNLYDFSLKNKLDNMIYLAN